MRARKSSPVISKDAAQQWPGGFLLRAVLATEGGTGSTHSAAFARALHRRYGTQIVVVKAVNGSFDGSAELRLSREGTKLRRWVRRNSLSGCDDAVILRGEFSSGLAQLLEASHADSVLLETSSRRGVTRLVHGSAAEEIARSVPVPSFIIGRKAAIPASRSARLARLLFATDGGHGTQQGIFMLEQMREQFGSQADVLHVAADSVCPFERYRFRETAELRLRKLYAEQSVPVPGKIMVENGDVPQVIVEFAERLQYDAILLVISRGGHFLRASTHAPSLLSKILAGAPCPVITLAINR